MEYHCIYMLHQDLQQNIYKLFINYKDVVRKLWGSVTSVHTIYKHKVLLSKHGVATLAIPAALSWYIYESTLG